MADGDKRVTRSQAASSTANSYLGFGDFLWGGEARRARTPPASPNLATTPTSDNPRVFFPSPETRSLPPSSQLVPPATQQQTSDMADNDTLQTLSTALSGLQVSSRKPELPPFDKNSIDKWIRRVESAYIRAGISSPVEKFAFIESKFPVDEDPAVDEYLFGDPTAANWDAFCAYLRKRHGKTKRQKAASILEPMQMDGRTPSQYFAKLRQSYDDITLDDIVKEICVRQLPSDIQQTICKDAEKMSAKEMMEFADKYYNPDGSRLFKKAPSVNSINNTTQNAFTPAFNNNDDNQHDESDVNAVRGRSGFQKNRAFGNSNNNRSQSRGRTAGGGGFSNNGSRGNNNNNSNRQQKRDDPTLCFYHNAFGDKARKCDIGCAKANSGNGPSPRQ